jgi:hypothetical protein
MDPRGITYVSSEELISAIREEASRTERFPVRLILVEGREAWERVVAHLRVEVDEVVSLSSFCPGEDLYPSSFLLEQKIGGLMQTPETAKVLVLPWAEWLRLEKGPVEKRRPFELLLSLMQLERKGTKRIYIPLLEADDVFEALQARLERWLKKELPAVWRLKGAADIRVAVLPFQPGPGAGPVVTGIKAYLERWEQGGASELILVTRWASHIEARKAGFTVEVYTSAFRWLRTRGQAWPQQLNSEWGEETEWQWLAGESFTGETFEGLLARLLNVAQYRASELVGRWASLSPRERWLVWLWGKVKGEGGYLGKVFSKTTNWQDFERQVMETVLEEFPSPEEVEERRSLLKAMQIQELPACVLQRIVEIEDPLHRLACLGCFSEQEKEMAVTAVGELLKAGRAEEDWWPYLERVYPELAWYLTVPPLPPEVDEYFRAYVKSRVQDEVNPRLFELASQLAEVQTLWKYPTRDESVESLTRESARVLWVDGMGTEWLGALLAALKAEGRASVSFDLVRANLPTITENNRRWEKEEDLERNIDRVAHSSPYRSNRALVQQLEAVCQVARKAIGLLGTVRQVIITADHGLTRFARGTGEVRLPGEVRVHKWGRCASLPPDFPLETLPRPDCLYYEGSVIMATHKKLVGQAGRSEEVHGGATPEEWLVPLVVVRRAAKPVSPELVKVRVLTPDITLNVRGEGKLRVEVSGYEGESLYLRVRHLVFEGQCEYGATWTLSLRHLEGGRHRGVLEGDVGRLAEIEFRAVKGLVEDTLGL